VNESQDQNRIDRPGTAVRDAMLVSCIHCGTLHRPMHPLAFHPVCTACA